MSWHGNIVSLFGDMRILFPQTVLHFAAEFTETLASLVDLLPTFTDIASDGEFDGYAAPYDGRSLLDLPNHGR